VGTLPTVLAATPAWFADNITPIAVGTLVVLTVLVVRLVQKTVTRLALVALIVGVAVFVYANEDALRACASTCRCRVVEQDIKLPLCDTELP
jgi:hypothetical protein